MDLQVSVQKTSLVFLCGKSLVLNESSTYSRSSAHSCCSFYSLSQHMDTLVVVLVHTLSYFYCRETASFLVTVKPDNSAGRSSKGIS